MDDVPPPPYSLHDPHGSDPTLPSFSSQRITRFNASVSGVSPLTLRPVATSLSGPTTVATSRQSSRNFLHRVELPPVPPQIREDSLLHQAVAKGKKSQVKLLLGTSSENIDAVNKKGETCLFRAVYRGDKDIVQMLLENNADPTAHPPGSDSPLHIACLKDSKSILKLLLEKSRFGIEERSTRDETPLYIAARLGYKSCVEILLDAGANPNARPKGKDCMLHLAVSSDNTSIAKLLLQRGVYTEELKDGKSPLYRGTHFITLRDILCPEHS